MSSGSFNGWGEGERLQIYLVGAVGLANSVQASHKLIGADVGLTFATTDERQHTNSPGSQVTNLQSRP